MRRSASFIGEYGAERGGLGMSLGVVFLCINSLVSVIINVLLL